MQFLKKLFSPVDMTDGTPWEKILMFAVPLLLMIAAYFILARFFTETWSVVGSIGAGVLWFLLLKLFDKPLGTFAKCEILRVVYHEEK